MNMPKSGEKITNKIFANRVFNKIFSHLSDEIVHPDQRPEN